MSELKPTMENLTDPYVLQLIEALGRRDDEIERLEGDLNIMRLQRDAVHVSRCPKCAATEPGEMVACLCGDPLCPDGPRHRTGEEDEHD